MVAWLCVACSWAWSWACERSLAALVLTRSRCFWRLFRERPAPRALPAIKSMAEAIIYMAVSLVSVFVGKPGADYHSCAMNPTPSHPTAPVMKGKPQSVRSGLWGKVLMHPCLTHCDFQSLLERNIEPEDTEWERIILKVRVTLSGVFGFFRTMNVLKTVNNQ